IPQMAEAFYYGLIVTPNCGPASLRFTARGWKEPRIEMGPGLFRCAAGICFFRSRQIRRPTHEQDYAGAGLFGAAVRARPIDPRSPTTVLDQRLAKGARVAASLRKCREICYAEPRFRFEPSLNIPRWATCRRN